MRPATQTHSPKPAVGDIPVELSTLRLNVLGRNKIPPAVREDARCKRRDRLRLCTVPKGLFGTTRIATTPWDRLWLRGAQADNKLSRRPWLAARSQQ